ncbi:MAG: glycosyltransferase [Prevotella sp.]|nr:glycosyltransferase [Prevotella sp.]
MIKFTIVTVTYNAEGVLRPTTDSVLMQSYAHVEHLIIDGASTDHTLQIAEEYRQKSADAARGHEIRIISEPDKGIYDAMQKGLDRAAGDYVCFLNAGDRLPNADTLLMIADKVDNERMPGVLYGDTDIVDDEGNYLFRRRLTPPEQLTWRSFRQGMVVCHQAFYARTDIAKRVDYDLQFRYSADVDWCIRVMKECENDGLELKNLHLTVVNYLQEGQTTLHHRASLRERFRVMVRHYGWLSTLVMHGWFAIRQLYK